MRILLQSEIIKLLETKIIFAICLRVWDPLLWSFFHTNEHKHERYTDTITALAFSTYQSDEAQNVWFVLRLSEVLIQLYIYLSVACAIKKVYRLVFHSVVVRVPLCHCSFPCLWHMSLWYFKTSPPAKWHHFTLLEGPAVHAVHTLLLLLYTL